MSPLSEFLPDIDKPLPYPVVFLKLPQIFARGKHVLIIIYEIYLIFALQSF